MSLLLVAIFSVKSDMVEIVSTVLFCPHLSYYSLPGYPVLGFIRGRLHNHHRAHGVAACSEKVKRLKDSLIITAVKNVMREAFQFPFVILLLVIPLQATPSKGSQEVVFTTITETLVLLPVARRLRKRLTFKLSPLSSSTLPLTGCTRCSVISPT